MAQQNGLMTGADKQKLASLESDMSGAYLAIDEIASTLAGMSSYTHPTYTARTGLPTGNQTPAFGGTFQVSQITSDATGHVTNATTRSITIPALPTASASTLGCVQVGEGLTMTNGVLSVDTSELILPNAASTTERAIWLA